MSDTPLTDELDAVLQAMSVDPHVAYCEMRDHAKKLERTDANAVFRSIESLAAVIEKHRGHAATCPKQIANDMPCGCKEQP